MCGSSEEENGLVWLAERRHAANRTKHSELITVWKSYDDTHAIRSNKMERQTFSECILCFVTNTSFLRCYCSVPKCMYSVCHSMEIPN